VSAIRKAQLNSVAAANHVCTILDTIAKLSFYIVLRAVLCCVKLIESEVHIIWVYGDFSPTIYLEKFYTCLNSVLLELLFSFSPLLIFKMIFYIEYP
jgi:hypothetical protein